MNVQSVLWRSGAKRVIIIAFISQEIVSPGRLPYSLGDRVCTTCMNQEVCLVNSRGSTRRFCWTLEELTFLNTRVLTGSVAMGKVGEKLQQTCMVEKSSHYVV